MTLYDSRGDVIRKPRLFGFPVPEASRITAIPTGGHCDAVSFTTVEPYPADEICKEGAD